MFRRNAYTLLVQMLNPELRYVGDYKSLHAVDAVWDVYALVIYNIKLSRERQAEKFVTYPVPELNVWRPSVRNHTKDICELKYKIAYCVVQVMTGQLGLVDGSGKTHKVNVQEVKVGSLLMN